MSLRLMSVTFNRCHRWQTLVSSDSEGTSPPSASSSRPLFRYFSVGKRVHKQEMCAPNPEMLLEKSLLNPQINWLSFQKRRQRLSTAQGVVWIEAGESSVVRKMDKFLFVGLGFTRNAAVHCFYVRIKGGEVTLIALHVDDLLIACAKKRRPEMQLRKRYP
jgi:hypothetical protein